ncbi:hypothetical protein RhiirA4_480897 [Rhizophagus irregularis]|uniref:Uncharacterized protein n=1 Tax=Rhizophagus irregularis TaxID=588596 RepID=A0A2I1HIP7_9GLOM|nr:hypothetical protein RhiirA4_480897 [Rhizophagus irregularis]
MELLAYFVMWAVENSLKNGLEGKVWMFRTFRDIISGKGSKEVDVRDKKQERKVEESMSGINLSSPVTPPNRMYAELPSPDYGASSQVDKESTDKRKGVERMCHEDSSKKRELKKALEEVVEIINQQREESKILYKHYDFSTTQNDSGLRA